MFKTAKWISIFAIMVFLISAFLIGCSGGGGGSDSGGGGTTPTWTPTSSPTVSPTETPSASPTITPIETGNMSGVIKDSSGNIIEGSIIQATGPYDYLTKETHSTTSDSSGMFSLENLPVGSWEIWVTKNGFLQKHLVGIDVMSGQTTVIPENQTIIYPVSEKGLLQISSTPPNANVYIDGIHRGKTYFEIELNPGTYQVKLESDESEEYNQTVEIVRGETTVIDHTFWSPSPSPTPSVEPKNGYLDLSTVPTGAMIKIDGSDSGQVTPYVFPLSPGSHTYQVSRNGYNSFQETIEIFSEQTVIRTVTLTPVTNLWTLEVIAIQAGTTKPLVGAEVSVTQNGTTYKETTDSDGKVTFPEKFESGTFDIIIWKSGWYAMYRYDVPITGNMSVSYEVNQL